MKTLKVAVVSSKSVFCDVDANIRHFEALVKRAADKGAKVVCFPELALTSYTTDPSILTVAESVPGPATGKLSGVAKSHDVYLSVGMAERDRGRFYITQTIIGPQGYVGKYRKHHLAGEGEQSRFSPGSSSPVFDIEGFRFGVNICFDGRFEDTIEAMGEAEVDVIHHPHGNWLDLGKDAEEWTRGKMVYFVSRAVHARAYILINNSAGDANHPNGLARFGSGALVIDPLGQVVKRTTQRTRSEKMVLATVTKPLSELMPDFELKRLDLWRG